MLDGQVGDAAPRVQLVGRDNGIGGAHRHAGGALAAVVLGGLVHRQRQVGVNLAEEKPAARVAIENQGVLALPAEAGFLGEGFFHHRRAVHEGAGQTGVGHFFADQRRQPRQPFAHQLVVVAAQGVAGHIGFLFLLQHLHRLGVRRQVVHAQRQHTHGVRLQLRRPRALVAVGGHPAHLAVAAGGQPVVQALFRLAQVQVGDAHLLEAQRPGVLGDACFQVAEIHGSQVGDIVSVNLFGDPRRKDNSECRLDRCPRRCTAPIRPANWTVWPVRPALAVRN